MKADCLYLGAAYYDEYMPESRVPQDMEMMKAAGMNVIRIAESTWSTWEPQDGVFDFTSLHRMLEGAKDAGMKVIVGTPTYAVPAWLAKKYPDLLAVTHSGQNLYGPRQNMDLTHPGYRTHCERIIRKLMEQVQPYENVIGFQLDNETHHYDTCTPRAQALFKLHLQRKFGTVEAMNKAFGFAYWSNSIADWEDLPDVRQTINGSYAAEYEAFQRKLVTDFLAWQRAIVDEYRRPDQFVTHNFDFEWHGFSYGLQPDADQFEAADSLTVTGCDIYHVTGAQLTGNEISLGGDIARGLKKDNYLVLETQAQGPMGRLPYPGQLRLQAFSHLASGANMVEYWHWHSLHNAVETYWKGVLSHDFTPGAVYREAAGIGADFARLSDHLKNLTITNRVAVLVSNRSLSGIKHSAAFAGPTYNDSLRWLYDSLYRLNVGCDILPDTARDFSAYDLVVAPGLYCAEEGLVQALRTYVEQGGHLLAGFRSFFADENAQVRHAPQPYGLTDVFGMTYDNFTVPEQVPQCSAWMELLRPEADTETLLGYDHYAYTGYAAATLHPFGAGMAAYIGTMLENEALDALLRKLLPRLGVKLSGVEWPVVQKQGVNELGKNVRYVFNYSGTANTATAPAECVELLSGTKYRAGHLFALPRWELAILEWDAE